MGLLEPDGRHGRGNGQAGLSHEHLSYRRCLRLWPSDDPDRPGVSWTVLTCACACARTCRCQLCQLPSSGVSTFKTLDDLPEDLTGTKVLVRVDLNVPMDGAKVTDDTRLRAMLPTVLELSDRGAIVLLLSHFGRPKGEVRPDMSPAQLVLPIHRLTGRSVRFIEDCQGPEAARAVTTMLPGNIGVLENSRFHLGEEKNDPELAKAMAALGDFYVDDSFSTAHRAHASTEGITHFLPSFAGRAMEAELKALERALGDPER